MNTPVITLIFFILLLSFSPYLHAEFPDQSIEAIEARIAPIGKVQIGKKTFNQLSSPKTQANLGKAIFEEHCILCHSTGIAGAPRFGNKADWQLRIKKKLSLLLEHVENGFNAMPRKGTCLECSSKDLKNAILYIIKKST